MDLGIRGGVALVTGDSKGLGFAVAHARGAGCALAQARRVAGGVTVNTLLPGVIATDGAREIGADGAELLANIPMGRLGTVEEFAAAAAFLCSQPAAYITGTALLTDGGATELV